MAVLTTKLGPLALANPIMVASGTFGYGLEYESLTDIGRIGAISVKGISLTPRAGNPPPRVCETPSGMLNAIGLANVGFDVFVNEKLPKLKERGATVVVNTYGTSIEAFQRLAEKFDDVDGVSALEINISCPNVKSGGMHFGMIPSMAADVTRATREATTLPVIVKLSPEASNIVEVARAVSDAGADALSLINTLRGMSIDINTRKPRLGNVIGGLSGPAVRPVAVRMVYEVSRAVDTPIIGIGGISTLEDALEFFFAGASAVQVGTANFNNPNAAVELVDALDHYLDEKETTLQELIGAVVVDPG